MGRRPYTKEERKQKDAYDFIGYLCQKRPEYSWQDIQNVIETALIAVIEKEDKNVANKTN